MGSYGHNRGQTVNEHLTLHEFWDQVVGRVMLTEEGFPLHEGWLIGLFSKRRPIPRTDDLVTTLFDGGERVTMKVFDDKGQQRVYDSKRGSWVDHEPRKLNLPKCREAFAESTPSSGIRPHDTDLSDTEYWPGLEPMDPCEICINVQMGTYGRSQGHLVRDNIFLRELWDQITRTLNANDPGFPLPLDWTLNPYLDFDPVPRTDDLIATVFSGGETVSAIVYDQKGEQRVYEPLNGGWVYPKAGRTRPMHFEWSY
ncbi:hypothetical protein AAF712_005533 [Marasmius tenuissimus]|uniref:Uncharacterized protein n=1 Tax=Marasmius tenuissimus TaxID=585030 RepID=A0ABR3A029_9AGAR